MKPRFRNPNWNKPDRGGLMIAGLYILLGGLWIIFSDRLAALFTGTRTVYVELSIYKGWGYVLVTGVLLYLLILRNNRALRQAHRDYLLLAENIADVIWVLDLDTSRFIYVSPSVEKLRGLTPEEALGETLGEAFSPPSRDYLDRMIPDRLDAFKQGRIKSYTDELEQVCKDGSTIWVEVTSRFVANPENGHTEMYAASRDITERWWAQDVLRKSERKFFTLFEKAAFAASLSKMPDGTIVDVNQAFEKTFGFTKQEAVGKTSRDLDINPDDEGRARIIALLKEHGSAHDLELALRTKSGEMRVFSVNVDRVDIGGEQYILNTTQDITERVRAEEQVRQMKRLYATLSQVNQTIVRVKDRQDLYQSICDLAVQYGEFALAWVGLLDEATGEVRPAAAKGLDVAEWPFDIVNIHTGPYENGLIAAALRTSRVATSEDIQTDERTRGPRGQLDQYEYHSLAAVPFRLNGRAVGVLSLVSGKAGLFKAREELHLLDEMGLDISFALDNMEVERTRRQWADSFEHCALGLALGNPATNRILTCNPAFARSLGRTIEEVSGASVLEFYLPDDHEHILPKVAEADRSGAAQFEARMVGKDGRSFPVQIDVVSVRDERGDLLYRVATQQDISGRKQAEQSLREGQERLAGILNSTMDAIVSADDDQRISLFNPSAEQMFGIRAAEVIGQPLDRLIPERFRGIHREHVRAYGKTNRTRRLMGMMEPLTCLRADGEEFPAEITISQIAMNGRKVYTAILRDITSRLQAEEALRKSETRYRGLFDDSPVAIWEEDFSLVKARLDALKQQGIRDFRAYFAAHPEEAIECSNMIKILDVNRAAVRMFQAAGKEELIETTQQGMSRGELEHHHEDLIAIANGRAGNNWEGGDETLTGEPLEISLGWSVVPGYERDYSKVILTTIDITERKQAEIQVQRQLRRMKALNEIDRAISSSLDMRISLDVLLNEVLSQLDVDAASVLLLNTFGQTLEYVAGKGFRTPAIRQSQLRLGEGLAGQAGLERRVVHVQDLAAAGAQFKRAELFRDEGFVEYFGVPLIAKGLLKGVLETFQRTRLDPDPEWISYLETLGGQAAIAIDHVQMFEDMQQLNMDLIAAYDATIAGWSRAMDLRDKETEGHTQRVTDLTLKLAGKLGVNRSELLHIRRGALLHDIGKLGVPDHILHKPGKLTDEEWAVMRQHPVHAREMLTFIKYLQPAIDIPFCHHEKWDGSGYPRGLKGDHIPLAARIFAVVDVWDALRSDRPYRAAWPVEDTLAYIREQAGKHFDPQVVEAFLEMISEP